MTHTLCFFFIKMTRTSAISPLRTVKQFLFATVTKDLHVRLLTLRQYLQRLPQRGVPVKIYWCFTETLSGLTEEELRRGAFLAAC